MKNVMINGAPRSGTSWLGQIFNSSPVTSYRFQPLFSYAFKDHLTLNSTKSEITKFFNEVSVTDDDFILQTDQLRRKIHSEFQKDVPTHTVMKHVRYHYLLKHILEISDDIKVIGIIRHPCGVINSWLKTPREFNPEWDISEWKHGSMKNKNQPGEYYGFEKWKETNSLFLKLHNQYPERFKIIQYDDLVKDRITTTQTIFDFVDLEMTNQTFDFLTKSQEKEIDDPDTAFRLSDVSERWKYELDTYIVNEIHNDLIGSELEFTLDLH